MPIPLRTRAFWAVYKRCERNPVMQQPPDKVRAASELRKRVLRVPGATLIAGRADPGASVTDTRATLADGTVLPLRVYRPRSGPAAAPVVVNFHGGGWVSGDVQQSHWWCSSLAAQAGVVVVSVEYRLAPEHPFPIPAEDCYAATRWVSEHANELGLDATRLAVMGDSAGGNLAAVVSMMARDRGGPAIALQVLVYPGVDFVDVYDSELENADAPVLTRRDVQNAQTLYFHGSAGTPDDPYASPLRGTHDRLPPALIQTAQYDPIRDQGTAYARVLRQAGVEVRLTNYVDAVHGYMSLPGVAPAARQALAEIVATLGETMGATVGETLGRTRPEPAPPAATPGP